MDADPQLRQTALLAAISGVLQRRVVDSHPNAIPLRFVNGISIRKNIHPKQINIKIRRDEITSDFGFTNKQEVNCCKTTHFKTNSGRPKNSV